MQNMKHMDLKSFCGVKKLICACSGGADSMVLATLLKRDLANSEIHILIVNHNLRKNSSQEANQVKEYLKNQKFEIVEILNWSHAPITTKIEEEARKARQKLIFQYAKSHNIETIFFAHHLGDVEENFFLKMGMGAGLFGITALKKEKEYRYKGLFFKIIRPLIANTKQEIMNFITKNQVFYVQDESNFQDNFKRNRIRKTLATFEVGGSQFLATFNALLDAEKIVKSRLKFIFENIIFFNQDFGFFQLKKENLNLIEKEELKFCLKQIIFYLNERCAVRTRELENALDLLAKYQHFTLGGMEVFFDKELIFFIKERSKIQDKIEDGIWDLRFYILKKEDVILPKLPFKIVRTLPFFQKLSKKSLANVYFLPYKVKSLEFKII
jgi:tRNA(Ile)-lysidine synthase